MVRAVVTPEKKRGGSRKKREELHLRKFKKTFDQKTNVIYSLRQCHHFPLAFYEVRSWLKGNDFCLVYNASMLER